MFLLIALFTFLIFHILIYFFFVKRIIKPKIPLLVLRYFLIFNYLGVVCYFFGRYYWNMPQSLYFLVSLSIGVGFILLVVTLLYQPLSLIPYFSKKGERFYVMELIFLAESLLEGIWDLAWLRGGWNLR